MSDGRSKTAIAIAGFFRDGKAVVALAATFFAVCLLVTQFVCFFLFSERYTEIYHTPPVENGTINLSGYDISQKTVDYLLTGEWDFYYGKWIVTDGENCAPDGRIRLPDRWTGMTVNGKKLSGSGYASYKITIENATVGNNLKIVLNNFMGAFRAYIDGKLVSECGTVSKDPKETFAAGRVTFSDPYLVTEDRPLTLVIELSACDNGGFYVAPWLSTSLSANKLGSNITMVTAFVAGAMTLCLIFNILINVGMYKKHKNQLFPLLLSAIMLHFVFSKDVILVLSGMSTVIDYRVFAALSAFTQWLVLIATVFLMSSEGFFSVNKKFTVLFICGCAAAFTAALLSGYTRYAVIPQSLVAVCFLPLLFKLFYSTKRDVPLTVVYALFLLLMTDIFLVEIFDVCGYTAFGTEMIFSVILLLVVLLVNVVNLIKLRRLSGSEIRLLETKCELIGMQNYVLTEQIKPHFIFNCLTGIQSLYRTDIDKGEQAITQFSAYLRTYVVNQGKDVIPFSAELDNTMNYVELESIRHANINILYNVDYIDFSIPFLTLQPLVENAIKYGGVVGREGGQIVISSSSVEGGAEVCVKDNGVGFDTEKPFGVGLTNTGIRLANLVNGTLSVSSVIGGGTEIKIFIPTENEA